MSADPEGVWTEREWRYAFAIAKGSGFRNPMTMHEEAAIAAIAVADAELAERQATIDGLMLAVKILGDMTIDARGKAFAAEVELNLGGGR